MKKICFLLSALFFTPFALASDIEISGTITKSIPIAPQTSRSKISSGLKTKAIKLLKIELSEQAKAAIIKRSESLTSSDEKPSISSVGPRSVQLGMNNVPVLDQGAHGSCVTFAVTAAFDAALKKGDYISQLCLLELGNYLESTSYIPSGWDGNSAKNVLSIIDMYGIVNKTNERQQGCGGLTYYPSIGEVPKTSMASEEYRRFSERVDEMEDFGIVSSPILQPWDSTAVSRKMRDVLANVKSSIAKGDRVAVGVLLTHLRLGVAGAVGTFHAPNDTWVLSPRIEDDLNNFDDVGGHEMVITGYDDNAIAVDNQGEEHRGLLTLRNSWSNQIGDRGDFYMSYDYFKILVIEAYRVRSIFFE